MKPLDEDNTESAFEQFFNLTLAIENFYIAQSCMSLRWEIDTRFNHSLNYNLSSPETIEIKKWYGRVQFTSVLSTHHILRSNRCLNVFSQLNS